MPKEQKLCCTGLKGCKDQLLILRAILQECKSKNKNVYVVWMDHQKPSVRVPHSG
jgi:hypothetical protein